MSEDRDYIIARALLEISSRLSKLESAESAMIRHVSNLASYIDSMKMEISSLESAVNLIISRISIIEGRAKELSDAIERISSSVRDLEDRVREVRTNLNDLRREFHEKVAALESKVVKVEKRVDEAERNLEEHLKKQDDVLESHTEALLNDLASQIVVAIKTLYGDRAAITLSQIQGIPLIAVEDYDSIRLLLVTDHPTPEIHELVETLSNKLKSYTDKKVAHKVLTFAVGPTERTYRKEVKTSGEPIWAFLAEQGT